MVRIRTLNEIVLNTIDFFRKAKPQLDTKPGTVARDLLINAPASQLAPLYEALNQVQSSQALVNAIGQNLDRLGQNFGATRLSGSRSTGQALLTLSNLEADVVVNAGNTVTSNNGATFQVSQGVTISAIQKNFYRSLASKFRQELDFVGITDEFAVEVPVQATERGSAGNISRFALISTAIPGIDNITNVNPFGGGQDAETDSAFRERILGIFSGANTGTTTGYRQAILGDAAALDARVVGPGNPLMTRDGTDVVEVNGVPVIVSEGTGGKVDVYVFGIRIQSILDTYIYRDKSNSGDATATINDFILGQIDGDEGKTVSTRRVENLQNNVLPDQPVNNIVSVSGSSSGENFLPKTVDEFGVVSGNYELIRDTGAFGGSPWGFDRLHWISDQISNFQEDLTKGVFNGQDALSFTDALRIVGVNQPFPVVNENSSVDAVDRSILQLFHYPVTNVSRVFNVTTGERYVVSNQNPDGTGAENLTGRVVIRGNTLPSTTDILQVDYRWQFNYDPNYDFYNLFNGDNIRSAIDVVDWGYSNDVRQERQPVEDGYLNVIHPVSSVISVNTFLEELTTVTKVSGRLAVILSVAVSNVVSIRRVEGGDEVFETSRKDGALNGMTVFLPTDTVAKVGELVDVTFNAVDVFIKNGVQGSFSGTTITLPQNVSLTPGTIVEANYIADVRNLLPATTIPSLPACGTGNGFTTNTSSTVIGFQPFTNTFSSPGVIDQNLRRAPTRVALTVGGIISPGVLTVAGTSLQGVFEAVFTASQNSLTQDLSGVIRTALGLRSDAPIPPEIGIGRVVSVEKVNTAFTDTQVVTQVLNVYDILGYQIENNQFTKSQAVTESDLTATQFTLPSTFSNENNIPQVGDRLRVTFYFYRGNSSVDDTENVFFSRAGTLLTQKIFAYIKLIFVSSGFTSASSQSATLTVANQNQPNAGARYLPSYNYLAPKSNERISIRYNLNQLIKDETLAIERVRPVTADVLVKASIPVLVDTSVVIVVLPAFVTSSNIVVQNARDAVTSTINATALGTTVDQSDVVASVMAVEGVDRVRVTKFNLAGTVGNVLSITAGENEYLQVNNVQVETETR